MAAKRGKANANQQPDMFSWRPAAPVSAAAVEAAPVDGRSLTDAEVIAVLSQGFDPHQPLSVRLAAIAEAGRRRLLAAGPPLVRLIRLASGADAAVPFPETIPTLEALAAIRPPAAPAALEALFRTGSYSAGAWTALLALHRACDHRPEDAVLDQAFALGCDRVAGAAAILVGRYRRRVFLPRLRDLLTAGGPDGATGAALGLALFGDRAGHPVIDQLLADPTVPLDPVLAEAAAAIGDADTIPRLRRRLAAAEAAEAIRALEIAADIGGAAALRLLRDTAATAPAEPVRHRAMALLAELDHP